MLKRDDKRLKRCIIELINFALFKATEKMSFLNCRPLNRPYPLRPPSVSTQTLKYNPSLSSFFLAFPEEVDLRGRSLQHPADSPRWVAARVQADSPVPPDAFQPTLAADAGLHEPADSREGARPLRPGLAQRCEWGVRGGGLLRGAGGQAEWDAVAAAGGDHEKKKDGRVTETEHGRTEGTEDCWTSRGYWCQTGRGTVNDAIVVEVTEQVW